MIPTRSIEEIEIMRTSALYVEEVLSEIASIIKPGISTLNIEQHIQKWFASRPNLKPSFLDYNGFPFHSCISVNDAVVHGFPSEKNIIKEGDIVSIDIGVFYKGFHGDSAYSFCLKPAKEDIKQLLVITKESLYEAIQKAVAGNRVGDISFAVQDYCFNKHGYGVVRELTGHGLGKNLHESPNVPNFGKKGSGQKLPENCVIAIEPMINLGNKKVFVDKDDWTVRTKDGLPSAHFEHDVCVKKHKPDILSSFDNIEKSIYRNPYLEKI